MKSNIKRAINAMLFSAAVLSATSSFATDKELLDTLLQNGSINKEQYNNLSKQSTETSHSDKERTKDKNGVSVSLKGGHLKIKSNDGNFTMVIGGRMMVDTAWFDGNSLNAKGNKYLDGSELHRFRIHVKGTVFHDFKYKFAYDFDGSGTIKDAWISYTGLEEVFKVPFEIIVGNDKEPLDLEYVNSSKYLTFMERGLTQTFAPERAIGLSFIAHDDIGPGSWSAWAGWYGKEFQINDHTPNIKILR